MIIGEQIQKSDQLNYPSELFYLKILNLDDYLISF